MKKNSDWLASLNERLDGNDFSLPQGKAHKSVFIVGAPRSGTTVLSQLMFAGLNIGYVTNLMACFFKAPVYGALLSEKLISRKAISTNSSFGQTQGVSEPHEFGGFWRHELGYKGMIQMAELEEGCLHRLAAKLDDVSRAFQSPVGYKVFQLAWHILEYQQLRPDTQWVWVQRGNVENALSILKLRENKFGSRERWASAKPLICEQEVFETVFHEVVFQVLSINNGIREQLTQLDDKLWLSVYANELQQNPEKMHKRLSDFTGLKRIPLNEAFFASITRYKAPAYSEEDINGVRSALSDYQSNPDYRKFFL